MCAFWGWIVELQILKTSVHFSSYPFFKLMYAFSKMLVSSSLSFGVKFSSSVRFFYLLNSCISSMKKFSIGYAFLNILHLHTLSFREVICYIHAFFGWIVELLSPKNSVHISSCHNFFNSVRCPLVISPEFGLWISYVRFLGLNSWIADLENLGTFFLVPKF